MNAQADPAGPARRASRRGPTGPVTHGGGGGQQAPPNPPVLDPGLEKLTHFSLAIGDRVRIATRGAYSIDRHKYKDSFVNPASYVFNLNAREGLNSYRNRILASRLPTVRAPTRANRVQDWLDSRQPIYPPDDGTGVLYPPELAAFVWTVKQVGGPFHKRDIVERKHMPMEVSSVKVPGPGTYDVQLRAVTVDNRFFERNIRVTFRAWFLASIGDSSASGQGNPMLDGTSHPQLGRPFCYAATLSQAIGKTTVIMNNKPEWLEGRAWRSLTSGPAIAAELVENRIARTKRGQIFDLEAITFVTVARSGAEIINGLLHTQTQPPNKDFIGVGQVDELKRTANGRQIDALMINIGGNDAGFAGVLHDLVEGDSFFSLALSDALLSVAAGQPVPAGDDAQVRKAMKDRLFALLADGGQIDTDFDLLQTEIVKLVPPGTGQVYITGYPIWLFESKKKGQYVFEADGIFSGSDLDVTSADYDVILDAGDKLNKLIKRKAGEFGWIYVEPSDEFRGRGYAANNSMWHGATDSCNHQGDFDGTMHPTYEGHAAWALMYEAALRQHTIF